MLKTQGVYNVKGHISHPELKEHLIWFELEMYRSIFAELSNLTKRIDYYKSQSFEA